MAAIPPNAFVDEDGSPVTWVFAEGYSALRKLDGTWVSPPPPSRATDLEEGYRRCSPAEALLKEARAAVSGLPASAK